MAVKKVNSKAEETNIEVGTPVESTEVDNVETTIDTAEVEVEKTEEIEVPEVEVETPVAEDVVVDSKSAQVNTNNKPNGNVKIRMRVDHKCCIAMERYDFKAGKTYVVPENVKRILNKAGLLAPL